MSSPQNIFQEMSIGVRNLTVLREFKPFGLTADEYFENESESFHYFLFDANTTIKRDFLFKNPHDFCEADTSCDGIDSELFIRGNRIIWSTGSQVHRRYTSASTVLMACWCNMACISDALLCVLQIDTLAIYIANGEVVCIPLPYDVEHIWPLPFGLLLQKTIDGNRPISSSSSLLNSRDLPRPNKDYVNIPHTFTDHHIKEDDAIIASHLILKHPSEEPQAIYFDERGKLSIMKDFEEKTIWTSDVLPLMVSFHKGKMQHSIWFVELASNGELSNVSSVAATIATELYKHKYSFRRIWQGKCSHSAASKVFLSMDNDGVPIICFLLQEQKILLAVRFQIDKGNDDALIDIRPHTSWNVPSVDAAAVVVTHPRVRIGLLPYTDLVVLGTENNLLLYSGKQCLCKFLLPTSLEKQLVFDDQYVEGSATTSFNLKITGVENAVEGRINVITNSGQVFRCSLRQYPSSSLSNDCIAAMSEGLHSSLLDHFNFLLWGTTDSSYLSNVRCHVDSEWDSFSTAIMKICNGSACSAPTSSSLLPESSWNYLTGSMFNFRYSLQLPFTGVSLPTSKGASSAGLNLANKQREVTFYPQLLREALECLHSVYENLKLNNLRKRDLERLSVLLLNVAASLGEANYVDYYLRDFPFFACKINPFHAATTPRTPPCLFMWLENCLRLGYKSTDVNDLPLLIRKKKCYAVSWARKIVSFYCLLLGAEITEKKLSAGVYCDIAVGSASTPEEYTVLAMVAEGFGRHQLDLLPVGVSLPLRHALDKCRESPPTDWPPTAYILVGREDLAMSCVGILKPEHDSRTCANIVSISVPYTLHLQPVTVPSSLSDNTRINCVKPDEEEFYFDDGMDNVFNSTTQLRYGSDLRLNEVRRLLCSARSVAIQTSVSPSASDQDLQQHQLWNLAQRTTALPFGRGAFTLATTYTLLTEALMIPKLVLAGRLPAQHNATVNLDPNVRNIPELRSWPEFHNGVAAGLRLAPVQGKLSKSWIQYNKPHEPNSTHGGLLLALGLHVHLSFLTVADIYRYLSEEHDITTVGILLGAATSHRGTMHPGLSKMLYLHIPSRHPSTYPELELPTILQSAALMAIGLLYNGSAHPLTMKVLLGEIGRRSSGDNVLEREGYAVAAGYALGFVALGRGKEALSSVDSFVDRLFQYIGEKVVHSDRYLPVGHMKDDQNRSMGQMMDGTQINVDVTSPGATVSLALIFLKTEEDGIASRIYIPVTHYDLQYVRPDFIMLRIIARNMIMWIRIFPSRDWVESQIPEFIRTSITKIDDMASDGDDFDFEALVQAYVNIVTGACISLGLRYAGTKNADAQEMLYNYAIYFLNEIKHTPAAGIIDLPRGISEYVDRSTLETCLHLTVLSLSVVMAGSGHLQTFRLLKYLRGRSSADGNMNYGVQMAVSLAIGFLFLGGGMQTFSTGNNAIAALLITLYPRFPSWPNDNRCHLQAFRHLYVIAAESRCIQTLDVDTGLPVYVPLEITIKETHHYAETSFCEVTPCILPERSALKSVRVCGPRYWLQVILCAPEEKPWWRYGDKNDPFNSGLLYVKRKVGSCSYVDDPVGCQSLLSRAMHKIIDTPSSFTSSLEDDNTSDAGLYKVEQLISTFSADPSLLAFSQVCCGHTLNNRSNSNFQDFCSQVLFECVSNDRPGLLQVYLWMYTIIGSMWEQLKSSRLVFHDTFFLSSFKIALAYNEALMSGKLTWTKGAVIQSTFIESIRKHTEEMLSSSSSLSNHLLNYVSAQEWPEEESAKHLLAWYLQWYNVPQPGVVKSALGSIMGKGKVTSSTSMLPLLRLLLPATHTRVLIEIDDFLSKMIMDL